MSISDNGMVYFFVPIGFSSFCTIDMKDTTLDFPDPLYVRELGKKYHFLSPVMLYCHQLEEVSYRQNVEHAHYYDDCCRILYCFR